MPFFVALLSVVGAAALAYPLVLSLATSITGPDLKGAWLKRIWSHIAALFAFVGFQKLFSHALSVLLLGQSFESEEVAKGAFLGIAFPTLLLIAALVLRSVIMFVRKTMPQPVEEDVFLALTKEAQSEQRREGLWAKCLVQSHGDEKRAFAAYVGVRVKEVARKDKRSLLEEALPFRAPLPKGFKVQAAFLAAVTLTILAFLHYQGSFSDEKLRTSITVDGSRGKVFYSFHDCVNCQDGTCFESNKHRGLAIDFTNAIALTSVEMQMKGETVPGTTTPWSGCRFKQQGDLIADCAEKYPSFGTSGITHVTRTFDGIAYRYVRKNMDQSGRLLNEESLICQARPSDNF
jgi:hypothetical protein